MKRVLLLSLTFCCFLLFGEVLAQPFKFAHVTDTHIGGNTAAEDLRRTIQDINKNSEIKFVLITGDITEFGSDEELTLAKRMLDSLERPWYIVPGNHDANWSESGGNSFREIFGSETFEFKYNGYQFIGTNSGPNMRMSPGQVPRENLVWMDSVFRAAANNDMPLIFINHYPLDDGLNNWYEVIDHLKTRNIQLALCGHGHNNKVMSFEGIPGVMGRSNLRAKDSVGGYNVVTIQNNEAVYATRIPGVITKEPWTRVKLTDHRFSKVKNEWPRPDFSVNERYDNVNVEWEYQDDNDLGTGLVIYKNSVITANTKGAVYALDLKNGRKLWSFQTNGKIYSTPAVSGDYVVVGSSDGNIYCLNARTGQENWIIETDKAVLGSPIIIDKTVYIGGSDNHFRALSLKDGRVKWDFERVKNYISSTPLFSEGRLYFGSWGNDFYALDARTGIQEWEWDNGHTNRMLSAAAVVPVEAHNRIFIVAPDRYMTALNATTGDVIWREKKDSIRVRESIGLAEDKEKVYIKTMDGDLFGVSTRADNMDIIWESELDLPYELTPSAIVEHNGLVFVPSHSGLVSAVNADNGAVEWQYKISNAMVNPITPYGKNKILVSSMDGTIFCLKYY
ncbi:outer membrane protein assembly factor BamB family protein [Albibacterium profundi]|uniref:PQQ-binding-like beta-propeller repeat protein n=1 Tax=Albibacterium profundi TaxID=3134906 RepID=A0ABV5CFD5_9SPHI